MAWSNHTADVYLTLAMGDRGALEIVAGLKFKFHPGAPACGPSYASGGEPADPCEVDAIEVVSLAVDLGGSKRAPLPLTAELCEWIADHADTGTLAEAAERDLAYQRKHDTEFGAKREADAPPLRRMAISRACSFACYLIEWQIATADE